MSDDVNFAEYVKSERDSLTIRQLTLLNERDAVNEALAAVDREFAAVAAYEAVKTGKAIKETLAPRAVRVRRGSRREEVLTLLGLSPAGMTRAKLLVDLGVKGNIADEMSVSNALTALQKVGKVERRDGRRWALVAAEGLRQAAE